MGHRLSKIYTRTGDDGETGITGGARVAKDHPRMEAIGSVDELNSCLGVVAAHCSDKSTVELIRLLQHDLFDLGAELAMPGHRLIKDKQVSFLEETLDAINAELPPLKEFILPGGNPAASACHLARSICRRAERDYVRLHRSNEETSAVALKYLNRLSDLLFVMARSLARTDGEEVLWRGSR